MKKIALTAGILLSLTFSLWSQETTKVSRQAIFNAQKSVFETSTEPNTIFFKVNEINDEKALEQLKKTGAMYTNFFSVEVTRQPNNTIATCKVVFKDKTKTSVLNRFFVANNIQEIIIDNKKVNREQFFNTPESW